MQPDGPAARRLLVVSHPAVVKANQVVYEALQELGWEVHLVIPQRWVDEFNGRGFRTELSPVLEAHGRRLRVVQAGRPQRHFYLARVGAIVRGIRPSVAFLEQEPFSASAWQWGEALGRSRIPFAVQQDENLPRPLPLPARVFRQRTLRHAGLVAARSPRAAALINEVPVVVVPHPVIEWERSPSKRDASSFVVGYAGRLVEAKGVRDLLAAIEQLPDVQLLVVGDGPLRTEVTDAGNRTGRIELLTDVRHTMMPDAYAKMDVLVLPSLTTPTWAEQFGRVLVEALWSGVPVVGSSSGEIPWVIKSTQGGLVFPEGDVGALANTLEILRDDPDRRRRFGTTGHERVSQTFTVSAVAKQMDGLLTELAARNGSA